MMPTVGRRESSEKQKNVKVQTSPGSSRCELWGNCSGVGRGESKKAHPEHLKSNTKFLGSTFVFGGCKLQKAEKKYGELTNWHEQQTSKTFLNVSIEDSRMVGGGERWSHRLQRFKCVPEGLERLKPWTVSNSNSVAIRLETKPRAIPPLFLRQLVSPSKSKIT